MSKEQHATKLDPRQIDWRGVTLGLAMVVLGTCGIATAEPWDPSDTDVVRWGSLLLAVFGVRVLWTALNDAYEASQT